MNESSLTISEKNNNKIIDFQNFLKANGKRNPKTLKTYTWAVRWLLHHINKDFDKLTKKDIINALATDDISLSSLEIVKQKSSHFFRFINRENLNESIVFNHKALSNTQRYNEDDVLTSNEIKTIINSGDNLFHKSLIEILIASGCRKSEITNLQYKNIHFDDGLIWLNVNGKTGFRKVPLVTNHKIPSALSLDNFLKFYRTHRNIDNPNGWIFYSTSNKKKYKNNHISEDTPNKSLDRAVNKCNMKHVTPHLLRHTSATYDGVELSEQLMCLKYGWKPGSKMINLYCHTNSKLLANYLKDIAGLSKTYIETNSKCRYCHNTVHIDEKVCPHCNEILDITIKDKQIFEQLEKINNYEKMQNKIPELEKEIKILKKYNSKLDNEKTDQSIKNKEIIKEQNIKIKKINNDFNKSLIFIKAIPFLMANTDDYIKVSDDQYIPRNEIIKDITTKADIFLTENPDYEFPWTTLTFKQLPNKYKSSQNK